MQNDLDVGKSAGKYYFEYKPEIGEMNHAL